MRTTPRGQVMVLACVTMLVMAVTVLLSFNVGNTIHERIRLQSHVDSMAFSGATMQARTLNTMAHTNRGIAAALVGHMSMAAYRAVADQVVKEMRASQTHMLAYLAYETTQCSSHCPPSKGTHCKHCAKDIPRAAKAAQCYGKHAQKVQSAAEGNGYSGAVNSLQQMIRQLHQVQEDTISRTNQQLAAGSELMNRLKNVNAPQAENIEAGGAASQKYFACALEGSAIDGNCAYVTGSAPSPLGAGERDRVMQSVAMAARVDLIGGSKKNGRNLANQTYTNGPNVGSGTINAPDVFEECHKSGSNDSWRVAVQVTRSELQSKNSQKVSGLTQTTTLRTSWDCAEGEHPAPMSIPTTGTHTINRGQDGYQGTPCSGQDCFINFRANQSAEYSFNQPNSYGASKQVMRLFSRKNLTAPWWLNDSGRVTVNVGKTPWSVMLPPEGEGFAVSKAKAYFHQLGKGQNWQIAPNSFDPFWHAKLHPFGRQELQTFLNKAGDADGATIVSTGDWPVEGDRGAP